MKIDGKLTTGQRVALHDFELSLSVSFIRTLPSLARTHKSSGLDFG